MDDTTITVATAPSSFHNSIFSTPQQNGAASINTQ
jgi:hypothetical protein